ncbi:MAG: PepSY domain-containing protein [Clostridia bacterium]|nr:PepSY domain-containing protein [Clostridia bacterium]
MRNEELHAKIKIAFEHAAPDVLDTVLSDIASGNTENKQIIVMGGQKNMKNTIRNLTAIAAAAVLLVGGGAGFAVYNNNYKVASTISLDVNPSVEITANKKEDVLAVTALNDDGRKIIGDMDFSGSSIDVTVNALIGSMLREGYLSDLANSILISVDDADAARGAALQKKLADDINTILQTNSFDGAVLSQTIVKDSDAWTLAEEYGITAGKAQLVNEIVAGNPVHTFEELAPLSINELNLLTAGSAVTTTAESVGQASDKAYIGTERAKEIAFEHAGFTAADVVGIQVEMDYEHGVMVYEVDFYADAYEYDYDINAETGEIVKNDKEFEDDAWFNQYEQKMVKESQKEERLQNEQASVRQEQGTSADYLTPDDVKKIAFDHAGVTADTVFDLETEFDYDNGRAEYEVDFESGEFDYDYDIDAVTGEVIKNNKKSDPENLIENGLSTTSPDGTAEYISADRAKEIALSHAGVAETNVFDYDCELEHEKGRAFYEVDFESMNYEHEYDIDAVTGEIIRSDKEIRD